MPSSSQSDDRRLDLLQAFLEVKGVDVVRVGRDLCMPSPFKEREKRRVQPGYVDHARRLSATVVVDDGGTPQIIWQCWYSKRPDGRNYGGRSAYAVAMAAGCRQEEVLLALDMVFDAEVSQIDQREDEVTWALEIAKQAGRRMERQNAAMEASRNRVAKQVLPRDPPACHPLFRGDARASLGEEAVTRRAIPAEVAARYGLGWDPVQGAVVMPWRSRDGRHWYHQWWDPYAAKGYRFPADDGVHAGKADCLFGLDAWDPSTPLTIAEGGFTAMSVRGVALGGSTLTKAQVQVLSSLSPRPGLVVVALDKDGAGMHGSLAVARKVSEVFPGIPVVRVFPPGKGDWNDVAKLVGADECLKVFVDRVRHAQRSGEAATMLQVFS